MIDINSLVRCNYSFEKEREKYGYDYPKLNDLLIVVGKTVDSDGEGMLWFDEIKIPVPLYENCFDEIQDGADGDEILNETFKIANRIR